MIVALLVLILMALLFPGFLRWLLSLVALLFVGAFLFGAHAQEWTYRSEQLNEERLGNRSAAEYFKQKADQEDSLKKQDPKGYAASQEVRTKHGLSANDVYSECLLKTPVCYNTLRESYNYLLLLPHGDQHPEMAFCELNLSVGDDDLRRYFLKIASMRGNNPENIYMFMGHVLTFMIPCPIKTIPAHRAN